MKNLKTIGVLSTLLVAVVVLLSLGKTSAATTTNTTLGITQGTFSFYKNVVDLGANTSTGIDIGTYGASLSAISAASAGDHRFTAEDMLGLSFTVTLQSSDLTATDGTIAANLISYTGTNWTGTGKVLTSSPTGAADLSSPVTFVARNNNTGISKYSQDITIKVAVPAAQAPGAYTGLLTFTY